MTNAILTTQDALTRAGERRELCDAIKDLLVDRLDLAVEPEWITDDQPLFGRGLELDSVDALEIAVGLDYALEVAITDDEVGVFGSVNTIADYVETHR